MSAGLGPLAQILAGTPRRANRPPPRKPEREFQILFVARSGSSHLAELLTSAGVGDVREWLNPAFAEAQAKYFGATSFADYFAAMRSTCPRGIFGQKMTIWFYEAFAREVRLEDHFDFGAPCVFLFRENIVEQAVSLCFAANRNVFHGKDAAAPLAEVAYNAADIRQCIDGFVSEEQRLRDFVEQHGARMRYLSYEHLACAPTEIILEAIGKLVGLQPVPGKAASAHRKLGDDANRAQAERFIEEHPEYAADVVRRRQWLFDALWHQPLI